jgi:hypothetical protein
MTRREETTGTQVSRTVRRAQNASLTITICKRSFQGMHSMFHMHRQPATMSLSRWIS